MTSTTTIAPPFGVDPQRWERASWWARMQAHRDAQAAARAARAKVEAIQAEMEAAAMPYREPEATPPTTAELAAELLHAGRTPQDVCKSLNLTPGTVAKHLRKAGLGVEAHPFHMLDHARRKRPCPDCGEPRSQTSVRCWGCAAYRQAKPTIRDRSQSSIVGKP